MATLFNFPFEHSAFLAALDFMWGRHKLFHPECTVPKIVQEAMAANACCAGAAGAGAACEASLIALRSTGLANSIERGPRQTPCGLGAFHQVPINGDGICFSTAAAVGIAVANSNTAVAAVPEQESWRAAFGLMVTIVWLYMEILRLLSILRGRD